MDLLQSIHISWVEKMDSLIASNYQIPLIIFAYLYFMLDCGPRFMKNRQPYSLKTFMKIYNIVQIIVNAWLLFEGYKINLFTKKMLFCPTESDISTDIITAKLHVCSRYGISLKIFDYIETGIFILRKKDSQVSNLHLYHHVSTLFASWMAARYYPIVLVAIAAACNCFIHVIMYTYYYLAALGPNVRKQIAHIKRWITIAQMVQFCFMILYISQNFLPACNVLPYGFTIFCIGNVLMNFCLFYDFYQKAYEKPKRKSL